MELHLRWIGSSPPAFVQSVLDALVPSAKARISPHPGGPRAGRIQLEGSLEENGERPLWLPELLAVAQERGDDALVVPSAWRPLRPRLACFDGDMTLVDAETIDVLGEFAGRGAEIAAITARAMAGELDFEQALRERVALLAGLPVGALEVARERIRLMPGAAALLRALRAGACRSAVFSGGFHFLLDPLAARHGIDVVRAHELEIRDAKLSGSLLGGIIDAAAKAAALREQAAELGADRRQVLAAGDGANDGPMLAEAGVALAFHPKPALLQRACGVVSGRDLSRILDLLDF